MTVIDELTAEILERSKGDISTLRKLVARLDAELSAAPLHRCVRLWGVSTAQVGVMFDVTRQAAAKWMVDGPPAARAGQVALLDEATELLDRWIKRERIPAVVRRPADTLGGRTLLDLALDGEFESVRDELVETFDISRIAP